MIRAATSMRNMAIVGWVITEIAAVADRNMAITAARPMMPATTITSTSGVAMSCEAA